MKLSKVTIVACALVAGCAMLAATAAAQPAGEVEYSRGAAFAQAAGQPVQSLGRGLPLEAGTRIDTLESGLAVIRLRDGTRMTLRPNSQLVLTEYRFQPQAEDNSMVLKLLRGGFRAVTGLISKNAPRAARIEAATATIGIRGTDFDARLCAGECAAESQQLPPSTRPNAVTASARVALVEGPLAAIDGGGVSRVLVAGGSVYPGDVVESGSGGRAVLAFRDGSRVSLAPGTRLRIDNFVFDSQNPSEGRVLLTLIRGDLRQAAGAIARANPRNAVVNSGLASVTQPEGGVDLSCVDGCGDAPTAALRVFAWDGGARVRESRSPAEHVLQQGQAIVVRASSAVADSAPTIDAPKPDGVAVAAHFFDSESAPEGEPGLYVHVRDGHIEITTPSDVLHLGRGETGLALTGGRTLRPDIVPRFIDFDRVPIPGTRNPGIVTSMLGGPGRAIEQCR